MKIKDFVHNVNLVMMSQKAADWFVWRGQDCAIIFMSDYSRVLINTNVSSHWGDLHEFELTIIKEDSIKEVHTIHDRTLAEVAKLAMDFMDSVK